MSTKQKPLRIVHLCTSDTGGGAAIAARRLVHAQRACGIESYMVVLHQETNDPYTYSILKRSKLSSFRALLYKMSEAALSAISCGVLRGHRLFALSIPFFGFDMLRNPLCRQADILHFHYTNQGFISLRTLRKIAKAHKKVVFTLHDIWHVAAICHYTRDTHSKGFELSTPYARGFPAKIFAKYVWKAKRNLYKELCPSFVGCSQWIAGVAQRSQLTRGCSVSAIPNIPDTAHFQPIDKEKARREWGLPLDRPLILYGAANTNDDRKGYREMKESINYLSKDEVVHEKNPLLVVFGKYNPALFTQELLGIEVRCLGFVKDPEKMALLYAASDLFLTTALEENLPNTIIEAQLCNCPSIAFAIGGIPEIITSESEGYLATPYDTKEVAKALALYVSKFTSDTDTTLFEKACQRYDHKRIVESYNLVYRDTYSKESSTIISQN